MYPVMYALIYNKMIIILYNLKFMYGETVQVLVEVSIS